MGAEGAMGSRGAIGAEGADGAIGADWAMGSEGAMGAEGAEENKGRQACSPLIQLFFGFASDIDQTNINRFIKDGNWLSTSSPRTRH